MVVQRLGETLVSKKIITSQQLEEALAEANKSGAFLGTILAQKGFALEEAATQALSEELGFPYVDLEKYTLEPGVARLLYLDIAKKFLVLPIFKSANSITVAMANPADKSALEAIQKLLQLRVRPVVAAASKILKRIEAEYGGSAGIMPPGQEIPEIEILDTTDANAAAKVASLAPVVSIVDNLITRAVELNASDIHLEPQGQERFYCRYRLDGILHDMPQLPKKYEAAIISRVKIMANMDIAERRLPQDGRIEMKVGAKGIDLRISTFPTMHGENVVIRILDKSRALISLEGLGMMVEDLKLFEQVIRKPHGILLVTGPTGSGKSTTLYAALTRVNSADKNIMTLEDPIEYEIERVRQSQVNVRAGLTFANGLRSIVRQDPDVIMIGEIRDYETAEIAIHAALTGHLVYSTLHTNDAASSATRLIDMGVEPFLVSSALICVVAQRLVRVLCPQCKEAYQPEKEVLEQAKIEWKEPYQFFREKGCSACRDTGYAGRIGLFELFLPDDELKKMIDKKVSASQIRDTAISKGMSTLRDDGIRKLASGVTSLAEVLRVTLEN